MRECIVILETKRVKMWFSRTQGVSVKLTLKGTLQLPNPFVPHPWMPAHCLFCRERENGLEKYHSFQQHPPHNFSQMICIQSLTILSLSLIFFCQHILVEKLYWCTNECISSNNSVWERYWWSNCKWIPLDLFTGNAICLKINVFSNLKSIFNKLQK